MNTAARQGLDWDAILAEPDEPPPTLDGTPLPKVGVSVLAGAPKVGKSLWASQTALVRRSTYIVEEGSRNGISYRLRRQAGALGIARPDIIVFHRERIRLDDRASVTWLREHVEEWRPELVVLDPLNRLHGADENRPTQMTPVMDALAGLAYDFACSVVAIHHTNKPSKERGGSVWDTLRGASSIRSGTDANLIMDGSGAFVRLVGEFRDAEPLSEYMELDPETLVFRPAEGPKGSGKIPTEALLAFVDELSRVTARDVMERFGCSKPTALAALEGTAELDRMAGERGQLTYFRTVK